MRGTTAFSEGTAFVRSVLFPVLVAAAALAVAFVGALLLKSDTGIDGVNLFVEGRSGSLGGFFSDLGIIAPLGFAFGAGVAAAFNPCGFAMLPAYMGLYLGIGNDEERVSVAGQLAKALLVGISVTAGFVLLFAVAGAIIGLGARSVVGSILPWLGLGIGVVLTLAGAWLLSGGKLYTALAQQAADRFRQPRTRQRQGIFPLRTELRHRVAELHAADIPVRGRNVIRRLRHPHVVRPVRTLRPRNGPRDTHADAQHGAVQGRDVGRNEKGDALHPARGHLADDRRRRRTSSSTG